MPSLHPVKILPKSLDNDKGYTCKDGVVTGFSGGVDSFCTIKDHYFDNTLPSYKITHLIFNNVGSHGGKNPEEARKLFNQRYEVVKGFTQDVGIEFIKIDSNLTDLLNMKFQQTHTCRNASAVLQFQKLFGKYLYASAYPYKDCYTDKTYDIAYTDPIAIHLLSTETLECISSGCQYSRVEKTERISDLEYATRYLNVCVKRDANGKTVQYAKNAFVLYSRSKFVVNLIDLQKFLICVDTKKSVGHILAKFFGIEMTLCISK